jgi:hypothetical protein
MRPWTPQPPSQGLPRPPQGRFPGDSPDRSPIVRLALFHGPVLGRAAPLGLLAVLALVAAGVAIHAGVVPLLTQSDAAQAAAVRGSPRDGPAMAGRRA